MNTKGICRSCSKHRVSQSLCSRVRKLPYELRLHIGRMSALDDGHSITVIKRGGGARISLWDDLIVRLLPFAASVDEESLWLAAACEFFRNNCFMFATKHNFTHFEMRCNTIAQHMTQIEFFRPPCDMGSPTEHGYWDRVCNMFKNLKELKINASWDRIT